MIVSYDRQRQGVYGELDVSSTLTEHEAKEGNDIVCQTFNGELCGTLDAHYANCPGMRGGVERDVVAIDCRNGTENENVCSKCYTVRRLTPLEAERLQGYPDGWTDIGEWVDSKGKKRITSDSARYKALGNSIAIPPWLWVCDQIGQYLGEDKTMASLFDGIGGFPLIWSYLYGKENVLFCSEIEEFPIAVTKYRFGDD